MHSPEGIQVGDRVQILQPEYAAGEIGVVRGQEVLPDGQLTGRWLVQANSEGVILSLNPDEFQQI